MSGFGFADSYMQPLVPSQMNFGYINRAKLHKKKQITLDTSSHLSPVANRTVGTNLMFKGHKNTKIKKGREKPQIKIDRFIFV